MAGDLVWTTDINSDPFVQSTNRMRTEAKRTRDEVQKSFQDMFFANSNQVAQRESAQRAQAALVGASSNNFFAATSSLATQDAIEKEQRLAMAQKMRFEAEQHQERQRLAMRARKDAAYDQEIANEQRLAQQKAARVASDAKMDRRVQAEMEGTHRKRAMSVIFADIEAEQKLTRARRGSQTAMRAGVTDVNRYGMAIQQLAFGLEDAATQFGTMGLAGAVRGASNNLSAAAMVMGPIAGIAASLGATALLVGTNFMTSGKQAREFAEDIKELEKQYSGLQLRIRDARAFAEQRNEASLIPTMDSASASKALRANRDEMEKNEAEIKQRSQNIPSMLRGMTEKLLKQAEERRAHPGAEAGFIDFEKLDKEIEEYRKSLTMKSEDLVALGKGFFDKVVEASQTVDFFGGRSLPAGLNEKDIKDARDQYNEIDRLRKDNLRRQEDTRKLGQRSQEAARQEMKDSMRDALGQAVGGSGNSVFGRQPALQDIQRATAYWNDTRRPAEKYFETIRDIRRLEKENLLDPKTAARAARAAWDEMQQVMSQGVTVPVVFRRSVDARSSEGLNHYYEALNRSGYELRRAAELEEMRKPQQQFPIIPDKPKPIMSEAEAKMFGNAMQTAPGSPEAQKLVQSLDKLAGVMDKSVRQEEQQINLGNQKQPPINVVTF